MKKTISLVITLVMLLSALSTAISANDTPSALPFEDLAEDAWYVPGIEYAYENGIMSGMGETKFSPSTNLTREQLMQVFFNLSSPKISDYLGNTGFNDVPADRWYSPAIKWAKAEGITSGIKENVFGLGQNVTREQLATFIMNYVEYSGGDITSEASLDRFTDADKVSDWAVAGMQFCVESSIINGKTETTLDPRGYATRAELAQMLSIFLEAGFVYRVDFDSDGADACEMKFRYIAPNTEIGYLPFAEKEGLKFDGWWLSGERIKSNTVLNLTAHTTLTAKWANGNRVFFITDGGECNEEYRYVAQGEPLGELPVPTRDGYSFEGWLFELEDESYIVSADTVIEVDVNYTLTAQWKPNNVTGAFKVMADYITEKGNFGGGYWPNTYLLYKESGEGMLTAEYIPDQELIKLHYCKGQYEDAIYVGDHANCLETVSVLIDGLNSEYLCFYSNNGMNIIAEELSIVSAGILNIDGYTADEFRYDRLVGEEFVSTEEDGVIATEKLNAAMDEIYSFIDFLLTECELEKEELFITK